MDGERLTAQPPMADRVLVIERVINGPREIVWSALTEQAHAEEWWAPKGCTVTQLQMDVRPGGSWRKCMRTPTGDEVCNGGVYREVARPERLSFTYAVHKRETLVTFTLVEHEGKTRLTLRQSAFESVADRDSHREGWTSTIGRLAEYLADRS